MGWLSPVGVPSPDGRFVAYNSWTDYVAIDPEKSWSQQGISPGQPVGAPSIHLLDLTTGKDSILEDGAFSLAWRGDGAIAYFKGLNRDYLVDQLYLGHVMVRSAVDAAPSAWTEEPGRYIVVAWAGTSLLAYRELEGEELDVLALDGPGKVRVLEPRARLVAVSPDGTQALVFPYSSTSPTAKLLDVASGREIAGLDLSRHSDPATGEPILNLSYGGSWVGDRVAAGSGSTIAILQVAPSTISMVQVLSFPRSTFSMGVEEPQFTDPSGSRLVAWAPIPGKGGDAPDRLYVYLDCDLTSLRCTQGPPRGERAFYEVYNPSRPRSEV